jgi:hypothetical protein
VLALPASTHHHKPEGLKVKEVLADADYSSSEALKALKANHITGFIANFGLYKPEQPGFKYFPQGDYYKCSQKAKLLFKKFISSLEGALTAERIQQPHNGLHELSTAKQMHRQKQF